MSLKTVLQVLAFSPSISRVTKVQKDNSGRNWLNCLKNFSLRTLDMSAHSPPKPGVFCGIRGGPLWQLRRQLCSGNRRTFVQHQLSTPGSLGPDAASSSCLGKHCGQHGAQALLCRGPPSAIVLGYWKHWYRSVGIISLEPQTTLSHQHTPSRSLCCHTTRGWKWHQTSQKWHLIRLGKCTSSPRQFWNVYLVFKLGTSFRAEFSVQLS